jgi:hypothetical protein
MVSVKQSVQKKKRQSTIVMIVAVSVVVHIIGLGGLAVIKIVEAINLPEFEAPPVEALKPPPPPPPPPTVKRTQRSMPRPPPLAAKNPKNINIPMVQLNAADLNIASGRGTGGGFGEIGGGAMDALRITSFGFDQQLPGTLTGILYDFKRKANGRLIDNEYEGLDLVSHAKAFSPVLRSIIRHFDPVRISKKFYKAERRFFASYIIIPGQSSAAVPRAFNVQGEVAAKQIGVIYKGKYTAPKTGRFRLFGRADDVLIVKINNKLVLDGSWEPFYSDWKQSASARRDDEKRGAGLFNLGRPGVSGDWFELVEGQTVEVDILISEIPGGEFGAYILIEEDGVPGMEIFATRPLEANDIAHLREVHYDTNLFLPDEDEFDDEFSDEGDAPTM